MIFFLGRTYILRNEPRRAVELNETMVRSYPDFALGHWFLGLSLIADNVQERAQRRDQAGPSAGIQVS